MQDINEATVQNDLREFIAVVEKRGELARVNNAHWNRELGAVTEVLYRQKVEKAPMLLFDEIPDYPQGYRCAYGMFGSPFRLATALGMEPNHRAVDHAPPKWDAHAGPLDDPRGQRGGNEVVELLVHPEIHADNGDALLRGARRVYHGVIHVAGDSSARAPSCQPCSIAIRPRLG